MSVRFLALTGFVLLLIFQLFPVVILALTGLRSPAALLEYGVFSLKGLGVDGFTSLFTSHEFLDSMGNSLFVSTASAFLSVMVSASLTFACTRLRIAHGGLLLMSVVSTRLLPPAALVLPLFLLLKDLSLADTRLGLILAHTAFNIPFCVWLLVPPFRAVPGELEQAAEVDGLTLAQRFWLIFLPLVTPALMVAGVFSFLMTWNDFLFSLVLAGSRVKTAPLVVNGFMTGFGIEWGSMAAASLLMLVPVCAFAWVLQKKVVSGITDGGVKG
jgi:multiple sugar transport system permease protein